jgi:hypothetical protein
MSRITLPKRCRNHQAPWWNPKKSIGCKYCYDYNLLIADAKTHFSSEEWILRSIFNDGRFIQVTSRKNPLKKRA